jgi:hypothetical protein
MPRFEGHFEFVEEHFQDFLLVATFKCSLVNFLVHNLDGDALIGGKIDAHLHPKISDKLL